jgi:hypothetical protein
VFGLALDLLDQTRELYRQAGPLLRKTMNQTIFTKLKLDGAAVTTDELAEPFDVIVPAGRAYERRTYQRKRPPSPLSGVAFYDGASADDLTSTDLLELALGGTGSSKPVMVGRTGFEPVTSSVSGKRSPAELTARVPRRDATRASTPPRVASEPLTHAAQAPRCKVDLIQHHRQAERPHHTLVDKASDRRDPVPFVGEHDQDRALGLGWASPEIAITLGAGTALATGFVTWELRASHAPAPHPARRRELRYVPPQ